MSTTASIAQFMAIMSGSGNSTTLRGQKALPILQELSPRVDFEALLSSVTPDQRQMILQHGKKILGEGEDAIITLDSLKSVFPNIVQTGLHNTDTKIDNPTHILLDYIQNQGNVINRDIVKIELAKFGIPAAVIDKLQDNFPAKDLTALVTDPQLKAQFEVILSDIEINVSDIAGQDTNIVSENLNDKIEIISEVITGILQQNRGRIENTITFKPNNEKMTDKALRALLEVDIQPTDPQEEFVPAQIVPIDQKIQPLQLAIMQSQMNGQELPIQTATPIAAGNNFFSGNIKNTNTATQTENEAEIIIPNTLQRNGGEKLPDQVVQSIADRLGAITQNANSNNIAAGQSDFASFISVSADGQSLLSDGDYLMPFSASFKTISQAINPLLTHANASQSHPATQMVAMTLNKLTIKGTNGDNTQNFRIRLDPPELGKVDIEIDFIKDTQKIKAVIIVDKPETLGLLQRDANYLLKSMHDAGFGEVSSKDISFNLSSQNDGNTNDGQKQNNDNSSRILSAANNMDIDDDAIHTQMNVIIDPVTGQQSVNMLV
jgi:flagellar hook-length control protein FliK